jgi:hypothetical protein
MQKTIVVNQGLLNRHNGKLFCRGCKGVIEANELAVRVSIQGRRRNLTYYIHSECEARRRI